MESSATGNFWRAFNALPKEIQALAREKFDLWKVDPFHGKLNFKCVDKEHEIWSVRVNLQYRALGQREGDSITWDWIGTHSEYDRILNQ